MPVVGAVVLSVVLIFNWGVTKSIICEEYAQSFCRLCIALFVHSQCLELSRRRDRNPDGFGRYLTQTLDSEDKEEDSHHQNTF